jgi:hypothetical protein
MNTETPTPTKPMIYLQSRMADRAWRIDGYWTGERTAYAHLQSRAENCGTHVDLRLATWEGHGSPYDGVSNPTRVLAVRNGAL